MPSVITGYLNAQLLSRANKTDMVSVALVVLLHTARLEGNVHRPAGIVGDRRRPVLSASCGNCIWEEIGIDAIETSGGTGSYNKGSPPKTIHRMAKPVGVKGQKPSEQYKSVTLYPINQSGFPSNLHSSEETKGSTKKSKS